MAMVDNIDSRGVSDVQVAPLAVVGSIFNRSALSISTGTTSGCSEQYCQ